MPGLLRRFAAAVLLLALMASSEGRAVAGLIVDATTSLNGASNSTLGTLDLTTGQFTAVSTLSVTVVGLTTGPGGTLVGGTEAGSLVTISGGVATPFGTLSGPDYFGLANAGGAGFFGANINTGNLEQVAPDGSSSTPISPLPTIGGSGSLAFGPGGTLYYNGFDSLGNAALFSINTTTGASTEIGTGLGTVGNDVLALVYAGGQLYGIDTDAVTGTTPINIYTIDTSTGAATLTGVTVSGLATGFTLDTATAVPEPSSLALCAIAGAIGLAVARVRRKRGEEPRSR